MSIHLTIVPLAVGAVCAAIHLGGTHTMADDDLSRQPGIVTAEFIYDEASFPECHASTLAESKGVLVVAWFGGTREGSIDPNEPGAIPRKVLKGGSFACAENYCKRYRPAARMHHPVDTGTNHISFRCVVRP